MTHEILDTNNTSDRPHPQNRFHWLSLSQPAVPAIAIFCFLVFLFSLSLNLNGITVSKFHPDESRWINRADYLENLLHPTSDFWADSYLIRGQPPMGSYMIGLGLLFQGHDLQTNSPWDFNHGDENNITWNAIYGNMPSNTDLMAARRMNAVLGALTVAFTFLIVTWLTNWLGGLAAALFLAINPLQTYLSSMALSDAFLTFDIALAAIVIIRLAERPSWPKAIFLGILLGFGASDKLTPLFLSFGLGAFGFALMLSPYLQRIPRLGQIWQFLTPGDPGHIRKISWLLLSLPFITTATFILSYPYLWSAPYSRTMSLIKFRQYEMNNQARLWPDRSLETRIEALDRIWTLMKNNYTSTGRFLQKLENLVGVNAGPSGFDQWLELVGIVVFIVLVLRFGISGKHGLVFALLGGQALGIVLGIRVDFNRYYLPLLLFLAISLGVLIGVIAQELPRLFVSLFSRKTKTPHEQTTFTAAD